MIADSVKFRGYRCFQGEFSGFDEIKPINVIIGRNNTGKSHLLKLAESMCGERELLKGIADYRCDGVLEEALLKRTFENSSFRNSLYHDPWRNNGVHFKDASVTWFLDSDLHLRDIEVNVPLGKGLPREIPQIEEVRKEILKEVAQRSSIPLKGKTFKRLLADRDVSPEPESGEMSLGAGGTHATNIVRRFITLANLDRDLIQKDLLSELNEIFEPDATFTEIQVQSHESGGDEPNRWEIFLGEEHKNIIALSESGSGLKTIFLVLLNLLVIPVISGKSPESFVFAFEELENNLHPALLRRLFGYLEKYAVEKKATIFLTTHSNVALDIFGTSENAQIIRVEHDGKQATARTVKTHFDRHSVVSELGLKPSDLLQSNGIIWVEGPSDRVYLNRWIDLFSNGEFQEGRDYQCAFYGGALLARIQFVSEEEAEKDLVNLFRVNPNIVVVCDGDRSSKGTRIKSRVRRINSEVKKIPNAHVWITAGREVENYLPGALLGQVCGLASVANPGKYESFFPRKRLVGKSFIESKLKIKSYDKMELANSICPLMTVQNMSGQFDLKAEVNAIIDRIKSWNS